MSSSDTAGQARTGLAAAIAGKAKEVAGAITGSDDLAQEGQLQQADARARRDANNNEAIAEASARSAAHELHERKQEVVEDKRDAFADAGAQQAIVRDSADAEKAMAQAAADRQAHADQNKAEQDAAAIVGEASSQAADLRTDADAAERDAAQQEGQLADQAHRAERQAAQLRAEVDGASTAKDEHESH